MNRITLMEIAKPREGSAVFRIAEKAIIEESIAMKRLSQISKQSPAMMKMAKNTRVMEARNELLELVTREQLDRLLKQFDQALLDVQNKRNKGRPLLQLVSNVTISPYD